MSKRKLTALYDTYKLQKKSFKFGETAALEENEKTVIKRRKVNSVVTRIHLGSDAVKMYSAFLLGMRPYVLLLNILLVTQDPHLSSEGLSDALPKSEVQSFLRDFGSAIGSEGLVFLCELLDSTHVVLLYH